MFTFIINEAELKNSRSSSAASDPIDRTLVDHSHRHVVTLGPLLPNCTERQRSTMHRDGARRENRCGAIDIASMPPNYGTRPGIPRVTINDL